MRGSSLLAWSLARKKDCTRPIWFLALFMVMGVSGGGGGRSERGVEERALNDVSIAFKASNKP